MTKLISRNETEKKKFPLTCVFGTSLCPLLSTANSRQPTWLLLQQPKQGMPLRGDKSKIVIVLFHACNEKLPNECTCPSSILPRGFVDKIVYGLVEYISVGVVKLLVLVWESEFREYDWFFQFLVSIFNVRGHPFGDVLDFLVMVRFYQPRTENKMSLLSVKLVEIQRILISFSNLVNYHWSGYICTEVKSMAEILELRMKSVPKVLNHSPGLTLSFSGGLGGP